jgi:NAD(P)-dependent dehydrogenase (short-subunit alcohol dehydrogenase family)
MEGVGECSDEEWDEVIAVNQSGVFRGTRAAIPALRRAGCGSIVNTASTLGLKGHRRSAGRRRTRRRPRGLKGLEEVGPDLSAAALHLVHHRS